MDNDLYVTCTNCAYAMHWEQHSALIGKVDCPRCNAHERFGPDIFIAEFTGYTAKEVLEHQAAANARGWGVHRPGYKR